MYGFPSKIRIQQHIVEPYFKIVSRTAQLRRLQVIIKLSFYTSVPYFVKWRAESITILCQILGSVSFFLQTTSIFAWGLQFIQRIFPKVFWRSHAQIGAVWRTKFKPAKIWHKTAMLWALWIIHREYYTVARRYEFYFWVVKTIFYERTQRLS